MRFLLVVPYTIPYFSGSGINAFNFARFLTKKGVRANLLSLNRNMILKARENVEGVNIRRLLYFNKNYLLKMLSLVFILPGYVCYARRSDIVVIYGGHLIAWELMVLFCKILGKQVLFQSLLNGADDPETIISGKPAFLKGFYRWIFRKLDLYHALNTGLKARYLMFVPDAGKAILNPQGVDTGIFFPVPEEEKAALRNSLGLDQGKLVIISIGSLIPRKGYEDIFRIVSALDIPFHLLVAGEYQFTGHHFLGRENEYAGRLCRSAKELLGEQVTFLGGVRDIDRYIKASDIALFNSSREGLPNALLEVMACGIPPVIREYPGLGGYFIEDQVNALVFSEPQGLEDKIRLLLRDKNMRERIGSAARASVGKSASFEAVLDLYLDKLAVIY
jgi:glycosyltransferase involved in cell wall biosynthesis